MIATIKTVETLLYYKPPQACENTGRGNALAAPCIKVITHPPLSCYSLAEAHPLSTSGLCLGVSVFLCWTSSLLCEYVCVHVDECGFHVVLPACMCQVIRCFSLFMSAHYASICSPGRFCSCAPCSTVYYSDKNK